MFLLIFMHFARRKDLDCIDDPKNAQEEKQLCVESLVKIIKDQFDEYQSMILKTNQLFNCVRCHSTPFSFTSSPSPTRLPCPPSFTFCNNQGDDNDDKDDDVEEEEDGNGDVEVEEVDGVVPVQPALSKTHVGIEARTSWKQILKDGNSSGACRRKSPASERVEQEL